MSTKKSVVKQAGLNSALILVAAGCVATLPGASGDTAGERFLSRYEKLKRDCEKNPPESGNARCNLLKVQVEDPMATPEGRFAHSVVIPNPMPANTGYREGMSAGEYFQHLCKNFAGEFIYKTVDNVAGLRQLRLREPASSYKFEHLYAMEDPYGHMQEEAEEPGFQFVNSPRRYEFFERPLPTLSRRSSNEKFFDPSMFLSPPTGAKIERYFGYAGGWNSLKLVFDTHAKARYAFTWRGISSPTERELGIAGGELIVLDTHTNEVLGVRRGFALFRGSWEITPLCPRYGYYGGFDKATAFTAWFTLKVARTPDWDKFFADIDRTIRLPPGSAKK